jgi:hypothetical protein
MAQMPSDAEVLRYIEPYVLKCELGQQAPNTSQVIQQQQQQIQIPTFVHEPQYANWEHIKETLAAEELVKSHAYQNDLLRYTSPTKLTLHNVTVAIHIASTIQLSATYVTKIIVPAYTDCYKQLAFHGNIVRYAKEAIEQLEPYASMITEGVQARINILPITYTIYDYRKKAFFLVQVSPALSEAVYHALPPPKIKFRDNGEHTTTFNVTFTMTFGSSQQDLSRSIHKTQNKLSTDAMTETYDISIINPLIDAIRNSAAAATTAMNNLLYTNKTLEGRRAEQPSIFDELRNHLIQSTSTGRQEGNMQQRLGPPIQRQFKKRRQQHQQ